MHDCAPVCAHVDFVGTAQTLSSQAVEFLLADTSSTSISSTLQKYIQGPSLTPSCFTFAVPICLPSCLPPPLCLSLSFPAQFIRLSQRAQAG